MDKPRWQNNQPKRENVGNLYTTSNLCTVMADSVQYCKIPVLSAPLLISPLIIGPSTWKQKYLSGYKPPTDIILI